METHALRSRGFRNFLGKRFFEHCKQIVEISADCWCVIESRECPVRFRRPHGMRALPKPEPGGNINDLRSFLNVSGDHGFVLALGWLIGALHPFGPYPLLILHGEQGSAKTTTARVLRAIIDPNPAPVRSEPREPRDLMIAANNGWICAFDNLSSLAPWLSDALAGSAPAVALARAPCIPTMRK